MSRRSERERRDAAKARLSAAGIPATKQRGMGQGVLIAVVILVVAVLAGLVYAWQTSSSSGSAAQVAPTYQATRSGAVVTAGAANAPTTVDVYEDFLCPACQQVERIYGDELTTALNEGKVKVNYHMLAILEDRSDPPGYSSAAGGAGLCAADAGIWPTFHARLFAEQPAEGGPGKTAQELTAIGQQLGATGDFAGCVQSGRNSAAITAATDATLKDPVVAPGGRLATPTIVVRGAQVDVNDRNWLRTAIGG